LSVGPEAALLRTIAPGVIWVAALLASMLSLPRMFAADHVDGTLEQMLLSAAPLSADRARQGIAALVVSGLPLVNIQPVLASSSIWPAEAFERRRALAAHTHAVLSFSVR
jgi:heme exporter protein B